MNCASGLEPKELQWDFKLFLGLMDIGDVCGTVMYPVSYINSVKSE